MLEQLFGSTARVKILQLFFLNPEEMFFVRQIARDLNLHLNSVRRELKNLEEIGVLVLVPSSKGKSSGRETKKTTNYPSKLSTLKKYYTFNKNSILALELRNLFLKSQLLIGRDIIEKITALGNIRYLVLTGKFTSVDDKVPTDILIVGSVNRQRFIRLIRALEKRFGVEINYTILSVVEYKYRYNIADRFLYSILDNPNIVMVDNLKIGT